MLRRWQPLPRLEEHGDEPHVADDTLWGAAVCLAAEQETATAVLAAVRDEPALTTGREAVA